jgi:hypothetical protein
MDFTAKICGDFGNLDLDDCFWGRSFFLLFLSFFCSFLKYKISEKS